MVKRLKARVGAAFDRRYVRRDAHRAVVAELTARLEAIDTRLAEFHGDGDPDGRAAGRPELRELAAGSAQAIESVLQTELRLWRQIDVLAARCDGLEHRLTGVAAPNDASEPASG